MDKELYTFFHYFSTIKKEIPPIEQYEISPQMLLDYYVIKFRLSDIHKQIKLRNFQTNRSRQSDYGNLN